MTHRNDAPGGERTTLSKISGPMLSETGSHTPERNRRRPNRDARRIYVAGAMLLVGLLVIAVRLVKLQVIDHGMYTEQARRQYESKVTLQADRGPVFDRNGNLLASNGVSMSFAVDPTHVENPRKLARAFSAALGESYNDWFARINARNRTFVWLRRKVSGPALDALNALTDEGLIKLKEPLRRFEYASLGAQAIGCTDVDNNGLNGVELFYNQDLKGSDGYVVMQRDARGRRRPDIDLPQARPEHGEGLVLTLDINVQGIVEDELKKGVERAGAVSGTAIAIDPRTGEILSIASYPTYDPNNLGHVDQGTIRVRAITDMYEPGSTMKLVTAAAALEEGVITPASTINGDGGEYHLGVHVIRDDHPAGMMSFREAVEHSSNIAFAKIASRIAPPRFYKYVRDFGFGIVSGIDLPGEARGEVRKPNEFEEGTQAFMAFGYQLAVTPLQLVCAYAAVANGGVMMKPHLLKRRLDREGQVIEDVAPQEIRRVVNRATADTLTGLLESVVEHGTGTEARVPGLRIAGKTGTSQQLSGGAYSKSKYNASFVGYFPANDPKVVLLVLLDSPSKGYYGGQVAAPIFREIARRIAGVESVQEQAASQTGQQTDTAPQAAGRQAVQQPGAGPSVAEQARIVLPDLRGIGADPARRIAEKFGCRVMLRGEGRIVVAQQPSPGTPAGAHSVVTLLLGSGAVTEAMPDLRAMSLRRALTLLAAHGIRPKVTGAGLVRQQSPAPGTPLRAGDRTAVLVCG